MAAVSPRRSSATATRRAQALRALIRPFMLRRTKSAVLSELPPRTEVTLEIDLPEDERAFYEALRQRALEALAELSEGRRPESHSHSRRNHQAAPGLLPPRPHRSRHDAVRRQAPGVPRPRRRPFRNRHKALVFSQFVGQLERVREALVARDLPSVSRRRDSGLGARKAGRGVPGRRGRPVPDQPEGRRHRLNLTAADYVIHLDPWWNPAVEDQASDRAHRIGQQRPVTIYRLIVRDWIEEKILDLHRSKRDLASDLLEGTEVSAKLSEEDLMNLMRV